MERVRLQFAGAGTAQASTRTLRTRRGTAGFAGMLGIVGTVGIAGRLDPAGAQRGEFVRVGTWMGSSWMLFEGESEGVEVGSD